MKVALRICVMRKLLRPLATWLVRGADGFRCGLRLARQVAKREGRQKPRKKKDKP